MEQLAHKLESNKDVQHECLVIIPLSLFYENKKPYSMVYMNNKNHIMIDRSKKSLDPKKIMFNFLNKYI